MHKQAIGCLCDRALCKSPEGTKDTHSHTDVHSERSQMLTGKPLMVPCIGQQSLSVVGGGQDGSGTEAHEGQAGFREPKILMCYQTWLPRIVTGYGVCVSTYYVSSIRLKSSQ